LQGKHPTKNIAIIFLPLSITVEFNARCYPGYDDGFCPKPIDQSSPPMHQLILQICESRGLVMALALQLLINNS